MSASIAIVGTLWALLTFYGLTQVDGTLYTSQKACERALSRAVEAESCNPAPGESCISGPNPMRECVAMPIAMHQALKP